MKKPLLIALIILAGCKKSDNTNTAATLGYDHTTPQGILLSKLASGSNKNLKSAVFNYYNSSGGSIGIYNEIISHSLYLIFDDGLTINPTYLAVATADPGLPIANNTTSEVHIDNGVDYLYYQSNQSLTPASGYVKVSFTLSTDLKTLILVFTDSSPGTATEGLNTVTYGSRTRTYTFVSI